MKYEAKNIDEYIAQLPQDRQVVLSNLREVIKANLPNGFQEEMQYGMVSYVVPHSIYPEGYHVNPKEPLPFLAIASQKNHIAIYHMGIYSFPEILEWFIEEYPKHVKTKLDMGKSCIRFKNIKTIPYELIGELCRKIDVGQYIAKYKKIIIN
ncbi:DUF1801 domain-containing protein [Clostridium sp. DL1XJH146]